MNRRLLLAPLVTIIALGALTGCSVGSLPGGSSSGGARPSPTRTDHVSNDDSASPHASDGASDGTGSGGASAADFPCNLYPISTISELTGFKVAHATPVTAVGQPDQKSCLYDSADHVHEFVTEVAMTDAAGHLQVWSEIEGTGAAIPDLGDAAWGNDSAIGAVFGSVYVEAGDESDASNDSTPLAHIGVDKLGLLVSALYAATLKG